LQPNFTKDGALAACTLDLEELRSKITVRTKLLILNMPHNLTGKRFAMEELWGIDKIVLEHLSLLVVLLDEVYEHIAFDSKKHCGNILYFGRIDGDYDVGNVFGNSSV
jgi:aspartate/methionine/tyrosine aminotransferase